MESATASTDPTTAASISASLLERLYRDALQSIFKFLAFKEFVHTCLVHPLWYSYGCRMKLRMDELGYYHGPVSYLVQSPLRIHITHLNLDSQSLHPNVGRVLSLLRDHMSHLEELKLRIKFNQEDRVKESAAFFAIPSQLQSLTIYLDFHPDTRKMASSYLSTCMRQIGEQSTRLVNLTLSASGPMDCPWGLKTISTLTEITLSREFNLSQQLDLINSMPSLKCWQPYGANLTHQQIQRLADGTSQAPGPPKNLEDIHLRSIQVDETMAHQLRRITSLTRLGNVALLSVPDPTEFLPHFPRLSIVTLHCDESVNPDLLTKAVSVCTNLTEVSLSHTSLTSDHLSQFLSHLVLLEVLGLVQCTSIVTLQFLTASAASLTHLRKFGIYYSSQIPVKEYDHVSSISASLESFTIYRASSGPFDPVTIAGWTPDSVEFSRSAWPRLKEFTLEIK